MLQILVASALACSVAYMGFRVWLLRLLVWSHHLCFSNLQSTCQPHHTPGFAEIHRCTCSLVFSAWNASSGSTLALFHSLRPLRMCRFVLHCTVPSLRPPAHSSPSHTGAQGHGSCREPRALRSAAAGAGSAASCGESAFAGFPAQGPATWSHTGQPFTRSDSWWVSWKKKANKNFNKTTSWQFSVILWWTLH